MTDRVIILICLCGVLTFLSIYLVVVLVREPEPDCAKMASDYAFQATLASYYSDAETRLNLTALEEQYVEAGCGRS
jgi:hypothetical protein